MGEFLQKSYYDHDMKKVSPHVWQVSYNDKVFAEYEDYNEMISHYDRWKLSLSDRDKHLLSFKVKYLEV